MRLLKGPGPADSTTEQFASDAVRRLGHPATLWGFTQPQTREVEAAKTGGRPTWKNSTATTEGETSGAGSDGPVVVVVVVPQGHESAL